MGHNILWGLISACFLVAVAMSGSFSCQTSKLVGSERSDAPSHSNDSDGPGNHDLGHDDGGADSGDGMVDSGDGAVNSGDGMVDSGDGPVHPDDSAIQGDSGGLGGVLPIPPRTQWRNYCGCCSIQQIALYYGAYVSQDACRKIIGDKEVLVAVNEDMVLDALSFEYEQWKSNSYPQYSDYLSWAKKHLLARSPVIITMYIKGGDDDEYDHILAAIGCKPATKSGYDKDDVLYFTDCLDTSNHTRTFGSLWDDRSMNGNCKNYNLCIPRNHNYGCAVTGIVDKQNETLPVSVTLGSPKEPKSPVQFDATITVRSLSVGKSYKLLRYDDEDNVPSQNFDPSGADKVVNFSANSTTMSFNDSFMSNGVAIYRCIRAP